MVTLFIYKDQLCRCRGWIESYGSAMTSIVLYTVCLDKKSDHSEIVENLTKSDEFQRMFVEYVC